MRIIEGVLQGSQVSLSKRDDVLQIHARLMVAKSYRLPQDMRSIELVSKEDYRTFGQWLIMGLLALTVVGLLIAIPLFYFGKKLRFKARFTPKHEPEFIVEGDKQDWKEIGHFFK